MNRTFLITASFLGALAVGLGAFGAHGLKKIADPDTVSTFQTGVQYQMYHALALLAAGILYERFPNRLTRVAGTCFILGIVLFSGSLYLLVCLKTTHTVGMGGVGIITPFGGLAFMIGWVCLLLGVVKKR